LQRQKKREKKDADAKKKKDAASTKFQQEVQKAKKKLADNNNKESCLTVPELKTLCKFYKEKGDKRIPTKIRPTYSQDIAST
jgi:GTP1/Obg family GTP-binding protein